MQLKNCMPALTRITTIMQNTNTLLDLGFRQIPSGEYLFRGKYQKFVATVSEEGTARAFVNLYKIHPKIDRRKLSPKFGCHFRARIKDCVSLGSVERAIKFFDKPEECFNYHLCGCSLNP